MQFSFTAELSTDQFIKHSTKERNGGINLALENSGLEPLLFSFGPKI